MVSFLFLASSGRYVIFPHRHPFIHIPTHLNGSTLPLAKLYSTTTTLRLHIILNKRHIPCISNRYQELISTEYVYALSDASPPMISGSSFTQLSLFNTVSIEADVFNLYSIATNPKFFILFNGIIQF